MALIRRRTFLLRFSPPAQLERSLPILLFIFRFHPMFEVFAEKRYFSRKSIYSIISKRLAILKESGFPREQYVREPPYADICQENRTFVNTMHQNAGAIRAAIFLNDSPNNLGVPDVVLVFFISISLDFDEFVATCRQNLPSYGATAIAINQHRDSSRQHKAG